MNTALQLSKLLKFGAKSSKEEEQNFLEHISNVKPQQQESGSLKKDEKADLKEEEDQIAPERAVTNYKHLSENRRIE